MGEITDQAIGHEAVDTELLDVIVSRNLYSGLRE